MVLLATGGLLAGCSGGGKAAGPTTSSSPPGGAGAAAPSRTTPQLGVVTSTAPGEGGAIAFEQWLGTPVTIVGDYTSNRTWQAMLDSQVLVNLAHWQQAHPTGTVELSVGLLPESQFEAPDQATPAEERAREKALEQGAAGQFASHWRALGARLVGDGLSHAILRLGWESSGDYYVWSAIHAEAAYAGYFRSIVTAMRGVPGAHFRFDWNTGLGRMADGRPPTAAYPGDRYVDFVGLDIYDSNGAVYPASGPIPATAQAREWADITGGSYGLDWFVDFARQHGKQLLFGEWGLMQEGSQRGGGDDPSFIIHMHDFLYRSGAPVFAALYFNEVPVDLAYGEASAVYMQGRGPENPLFPVASRTFRSLFGRT